MSVALADLLIDLADPAKLQEFNKDPETVMADASLDEADKAALRSRNPGWIQHQAKTQERCPQMAFAPAGVPVGFDGVAILIHAFYFDVTFIDLNNLDITVVDVAL